MAEQIELDLFEQWRPVVGYEGLYEVSDMGRVRSLDRVVSCPRARSKTRLARGILMRPSVIASGHLAAQLSRSGDRKTVGVHRLVLEAFVGPCPDGMEACHYNDIADDNRLSNLRWGTRSDNFYDRVRNGRHHGTNKTHCPSGHEYTPENTKHNRGSRHCRECERIYARERYRRSVGWYTRSGGAA